MHPWECVTQPTCAVQCAAGPASPSHRLGGHSNLLQNAAHVLRTGLALHSEFRDMLRHVARTLPKSKMMWMPQSNSSDPLGHKVIERKADLGGLLCMFGSPKVLIQYWDGDDPATRIEKCLVRKIWS